MDPKHTSKPDFSDVKGGASSAAPPPRPEAADAPERRTYTVEKGDTLSGIARSVYGSANRWRAIYEANRDTIKNPDLIFPGQVLTLPEEPVS